MAYEYAHDPINADATPLYNDNILKFWNWFNTVWGCNDWLTWHKAMYSKYGKDAANQKFLTYWNDLATGSSAIDCRSFSTSFRNYFRSVGLLDQLYSGLGIVAKPLGTATDVATNVEEGISSASKVFRVMLPLALILIAIIAIVYLRSKSKSIMK